jgi:two-component system, cell cycle sensor histidine kinase and response regulator CckA
MDQKKNEINSKFISLRVKLAFSFLALSILVLLTFGLLNTYFNFRNQKTIITAQQNLIAQKAADSVKGFLEAKFSILRGAEGIGNIESLPGPQQKLILQQLLGIEKSFRQLVLFDSSKHELARSSRLSRMASGQMGQNFSEKFFLRSKSEKLYTGSVYIDEITSEPLIIMAVAVTDVYGDFKGILAAEVNLKFMWDLVGSMKIGRSGLAYVVDSKGKLIAFGDVSRVLRSESLSRLKIVQKFLSPAHIYQDHAYLTKGILGNYVTSVLTSLVNPDWAVVVEMPISEAYAGPFNLLFISLLMMLLSFIIAVVFGIYLSEKITEPLIELRDATEKVGQGNLDIKVVSGSNDEISQLAASFNQMVKDLNNTTVSRDSLVREIEEHKKTDESLQKSEEEFRLTFENSKDAIIWTSPRTGKILKCNKAAETLLERERSEIVGANKRIIYPPDKADHYSDYFRNLFAETNAYADEAEVLARSGNIKPVHVAASFVTIRGEPVIQEIFSDITDRKQSEMEKERLQKRLVQAEKMEAIGRLVGGIAHDFNNMLTPIVGLSDMCLRMIDDKDTVTRNLEDIRTVSKKAQALINQLLTFARKQVVKPEVLNINRVVEKNKGLIQQLLGDNIKLVAILAYDAGNIDVEESSLEQAIINLVVNAREAMPRGGRVTIETSNVGLFEKYDMKNLEIRSGDYVQLAVTDTGQGIDEETRQHIFEPFFSTKGGTGTGLGLSTVYGIVKQRGGEILVYSEVGRGTTFKLYFPRIFDRAAQPEKARQPFDEKLFRGAETVLVVEDDEIVRNVFQQILTTFGYRVILSSNGDEGARVLAEKAAMVDLVVCDVIMPGAITSRDIARMVKEMEKPIKLLLVSGYTENTIVQELSLGPGTDFMQKPFDPETLLRKVRGLLGSV